MILPRAVAVQGLGYSPFLVAVKGLWEYTVPSAGNRRAKQIFLTQERTETVTITPSVFLWIKN